MILTIIKHFFIIYSSFYLYHKILNTNSSKPQNKFLFFAISLLIASLGYFFIHNLPNLAIIFIILLFYFFILLISPTKPNTAFVATIISFSISYSFFSLFILIVITLFYAFSFDKNNLPLTVIMFLTGILTFSCVHIPFFFKRLKNGMRFLYQERYINLGLFISTLPLIFFTFARLHEFPGDIIVSLQLVFIFILGFLLLFWWKNQITKSYLEKIRKAELESLRQEVIDKDAEIQKLRENNDSLAHIIHRDNKLIPAMESAVCEFLEDYALLSPNDFHAKGQALASQLKEMSASRTGILTEYQAKGQHIPITGVCSVDALFSYMQKKASSFEIAFDVKISTDLLTFTNSVISPDDLAHLLSDLIENAIIASKNSLARKIQLHISFISNHYVVEILDTGEAFPIDILQDFGIQQKTSHASEGGSGIGLMDIWKLKKKYRASLHIQEFSSDHDSFQKKISLIFDSKNHYLIQTYRPQEILMTLKRSDLYVLENET